MLTPDITPAQVLALVTFVVGELVSNLWINSHTGKMVTDIAAIVVPVAWILADAHIRHGRAMTALAIVESKNAARELDLVE